jgi:citrate lyase beta subunit
MPRAPFRLAGSAGQWVLTAAVVLLAGCASLAQPDSSLPQTPVPTAWSAQAPAGVPATSLAQWWQRFDDPQLTRLVTQALQANTSLRSAQAALQQARAQADVQAAGLLPSVGASASAQRSRASNSTGNSFQAGFDASWEPDVFGRLRSGVNASTADAQAAEASLADVQVSLAAETAVNYIELRGLQQRLAIARSNLASQQETLQITQWRLQAGLTTSLVAEQARGAAEQTAAQIPALESGLAQSRHSLAVLTGQAPLALDTLLADAAAVPQPAQDLALARSVQAVCVMLPKCEAPAQVSAVLVQLTSNATVLPLIETARGMLALPDIAAAPGVARLAFGALDYMADLDIQADSLALDVAASQIAVASRAAGLASPLAGVTPALDAAQVSDDMRHARSLGFGAKICIHPAQVAAVRAALAPSDQELAWAHRVLQAWQASGAGAFQLDGKMVDRPVVLKAQRIAAQAARTGSPLIP